MLINSEVKFCFKRVSLRLTLLPTRVSSYQLSRKIDFPLPLRICLDSHFQLFSILSYEFVLTSRLADVTGISPDNFSGIAPLYVSDVYVFSKFYLICSLEMKFHFDLFQKQSIRGVLGTMIFFSSQIIFSHLYYKAKSRAML